MSAPLTVINNGPNFSLALDGLGLEPFQYTALNSINSPRQPYKNNEKNVLHFLKKYFKFCSLHYFKITRNKGLLERESLQDILTAKNTK